MIQHLQTILGNLKLAITKNWQFEIEESIKQLQEMLPQASVEQ